MTWTDSLRRFINDSPWQLWTAQVMAVMRIEIRKNLFRLRSIWIYLVAFVPVLIIAGHVIQVTLFRQTCDMTDDTQILAGFFQFYDLRLAIFFACMGLFTWLMRGEVVEKTLHYYFLSPMRREVLVLGKFLAGLISTVSVFGTSVLLSFILMYAHFGAAGRAYVFAGPGLGQLIAYLWVTVLACLGYGTVFLALSLLFKNPIIPGLFVLLWETFHPVFPSMLQKFSVMFYLKQLCPVTVPLSHGMSLFAVLAEPVSPWLAVPGLLLLSGAILTFACWRIRRTEISYLAD